QAPRVLGIERMFRVDKRGRAPGPLRFSDDLQRQSRLARRLRPKHLDDAPPRKASYTERVVEGDRAGRDHRNRQYGLGTQAQDRSFAELLLHLEQRQVNCEPPFLFVNRTLPSRWCNRGGEILRKFSPRRHRHSSPVFALNNRSCQYSTPIKNNPLAGAVAVRNGPPPSSSARTSASSRFPLPA